MLPELAEVVDEGFAKSPRQNPYYLGLYPCHQAVADPDSAQVTDRSGKAAHATLGALSAAEAWANAGYVSSVATTDKCARIPVALWPFRFSAGNLVVFAYQRLVTDTINALRIFGNGSNGANTGFNVLCTSVGGIQIQISNTVGSSNFSGSTLGYTPYATDSLHSWMVAYRKSTNGWSIWVDGTRAVTEDAVLSRTTMELADAVVTSGPAFGGRPINTSPLVAVRTKHIHIFNFERDLPINLDVIAKRLHMAPHLEIPESAVVF